MEWKSIETAPKDGTAVLVYPPIWNGRTVSVAHWNDDRYSKRPRPYWKRDDDHNRTTVSRDKPPTHWMPLPPPPEVD